MKGWHPKPPANSPARLQAFASAGVAIPSRMVAQRRGEIERSRIARQSSSGGGRQPVCLESQSVRGIRARRRSTLRRLRASIRIDAGPVRNSVPATSRRQGSMGLARVEAFPGPAAKATRAGTEERSTLESGSALVAAPAGRPLHQGSHDAPGQGRASCRPRRHSPSRSGPPASTRHWN